MDDRWTLAGLAEASGIPARTIRFYIARGILDGPVKGGRGAEYTADHLRRLERIQHLQAEGRTLAEIAAALSGRRPRGPEPAPWWQYALADDVVVWIKADSSPWRLKQLRAAIDEFARRLPQGSSTEEEKE
jgi:DNA-binding transcriptional MerR regulator